MLVPGSPFLLTGGLNHPFSWYAKVREKKGAKKEWTYWMNGTQLTREDVAIHIARMYSNVEVLTIDRCTTPPTRPLVPVPRHHYQFGLIPEPIVPITTAKAETIRAMAREVFAVRQPYAARRPYGCYA